MVDLRGTLKRYMFYRLWCVFVTLIVVYKNPTTKIEVIWRDFKKSRCLLTRFLKSCCHYYIPLTSMKKKWQKWHFFQAATFACFLIVDTPYFSCFICVKIYTSLYYTLLWSITIFRWKYIKYLTWSTVHSLSFFKFWYYIIHTE